MKKTIRFILIFILSGVAFFLLTLPFHKILAVFTASEVRPSAVLYPFLGISFGWPAALGIMVANLISDAMNGYPVALLIEGIIPQLLYTMVPYYMWKKLMNGEEHKHRLDCVGRVLKYVLVCFVFSVLSAIGVGIIIYVNFNVNPLQSAPFVLLNNFDMSVILGCPLMVLSNQIISRRAGSDRTLTRNEIIILRTALVQVLIMAAVVIVIYTSGTTVGTYDVWNTVYIVGLILINISMLISLICMVIFDSKKE